MRLSLENNVNPQRGRGQYFRCFWQPQYLPSIRFFSKIFCILEFLQGKRKNKTAMPAQCHIFFLKFFVSKIFSGKKEKQTKNASKILFVKHFPREKEKGKTKLLQLLSVRSISKIHCLLEFPREKGKTKLLQLLSVRSISKLIVYLNFQGKKEKQTENA